MRLIKRGGPYFAPTMLRDKGSWFWRYGLTMDATLVAWDTIANWPEVRGLRLKRAWGIKSTLIVDSGAFGMSPTASPAELVRGQLLAGADIVVALDRIASAADSNRRQWRLVEETVANARTAKRLVRGRAALEVVVQGVTTRQRQHCATELARLKPTVYGIPLSGESRRRAYKEAARKVLDIQQVLPKNAIVHAMGVGSRTLMAVLGALDVTFFDSSSCYESAVHNQAIPPVTMCHFARPLDKAMCRDCQSTAALRNPPSNRTEMQVHHNLVEVGKEIIRVRCAKAEGVLGEYLTRRLTGPVAKDVVGIVAKALTREGTRR